MGTASLMSSPPAAVLGQALLFSTDIEVLEQEEARGIYTLERVKVKRPGLIEAVIAGTADGEGQLSMAGKLNCHHRTISIIQNHPDYAEPIDIARAKRVARLRSAGDKLIELIDNDPHSVPPNMRALAASQCYDKAELLDGRATARVEHAERIDIYGDWDHFIEKNLEPGDVREIGSGEGNVSPIALPASSSEQADRDSLSAVQPSSSLVDVPDDTDSDTDRARPEGSEKRGGGGLSSGQGGHDLNSSTGSQNF